MNCMHKSDHNPPKPHYIYSTHCFGLTVPKSSVDHFFRSNWAFEQASLLSVYPQSQTTAHCSVVLCQKWFDQQCRSLPTAQFLQWGSGSLHLALRFWNLISGGRVKGWGPWPDPAENGACVKRFTPWAGREGFRSSVEAETLLAPFYL